jgi:predicted dehydrogenase
MLHVNAALVGCGGMGRGLITAAAKLPNCTVKCVSDPVEELARKLAEELGCDWTTSSDELLAREDVNAVFIAAPNFLHPPLTIQAARAGKHIFCEKPFALTVEDARQMIAAADQAGVKLMVGQVLRYIAPYVYIWDLVKSGKLGKPFCIQVTRIGGPWGDWAVRSPWRLKAATCGGPLFEFSAHEIDFMRTLMGCNVSRVCGSLKRHVDDTIDYEDTAYVMMEFENGGQGCLLAGHSAVLATYDGKVYLTEGTIYYDSKTSKVTYQKKGEDPVEVAYGDAGKDYPEGGVDREVREFVEAVANDTPVTIPGTEGLQNTMVAVAAHLSEEQGRPVDLPL